MSSRGYCLPDIATVLIPWPDPGLFPLEKIFRLNSRRKWWRQIYIGEIREGHSQRESIRWSNESRSSSGAFVFLTSFWCSLVITRKIIVTEIARVLPLYQLEEYLCTVPTAVVFSSSCSLNLLQQEKESYAGATCGVIQTFKNGADSTLSWITLNNWLAVRRRLKSASMSSCKIQNRLERLSRDLSARHSNLMGTTWTRLFNQLVDFLKLHVAHWGSHFCLIDPQTDFLTAVVNAVETAKSLEFDDKVDSQLLNPGSNWLVW